MRGGVCHDSSLKVLWVWKHVLHTLFFNQPEACKRCVQVSLLVHRYRVASVVSVRVVNRVRSRAIISPIIIFGILITVVTYTTRYCAIKELLKHSVQI